MKKTISILAIILSLTLLLASCGKSSENNNATSSSTANPELVKNKITATIELEDYDDITLELYPDLAPETVEKFVELAEDGFYDGTVFHRVIEDFMIQGGGYDENLKQKKTSSIKGEFKANGFENTLSHVRGVISMARAQDMNSATSQFFIVQKDSQFLDGQYAAFGMVTDGMDVVDEIASVRTGSVAASGMENVPVDQIIIETISIDSNGSSSNNKKSSKNNSKNNDKDSENDKSSSSSNSKDKDDDKSSTSSNSKDKDDDKSSTSSNSKDKDDDKSSSSSNTKDNDSEKTSKDAEDDIMSLFA